MITPANALGRVVLLEELQQQREAVPPDVQLSRLLPSVSDERLQLANVFCDLLLEQATEETDAADADALLRLVRGQQVPRRYRRLLQQARAEVAAMAGDPQTNVVRQEE
jgi:hypothetical protein